MFKNIVFDAISVKQRTTNRFKRFGQALSIAIIGLTVIGTAHAQEQDQIHDDAVRVTVFQAAGPNASSIQSTVDQFRNALGNNNGITITPPATPLTTGRREINWDGGSTAVTATTITPTPTDNFLNGRGARFTTTGSGFVQAPPSGLVDVFGNPSYATVFKAFSRSGCFRPSAAT